jgi:hypothetical protein
VLFHMMRMKNLSKLSLHAAKSDRHCQRTLACRTAPTRYREVVLTVSKTELVTLRSDLDTVIYEASFAVKNFLSRPRA